MEVGNENKEVGLQATKKSGIIYRFAKHRNAANLVLCLMVIGGVFGLLKLNSQFLPSFGIDVVNVMVEWPGATADDVDINVVQAIEPEVRFLDRVKRVKSSAYPGLARIRIEFEAGSDMQPNSNSGLCRDTRIMMLSFPRGVLGFSQLASRISD